MSIATEITRLQGAKSSLKTSIEGKGVTIPSATKIDGYAALVDQIQAGGDTDGLNGFLSVESKTIATSASQTTNITYNKNCGILDENYKKWDTLAWHQRWVDNGYSATGLSNPIGIWMNAFGLELVYLWPLTLDVGYSDVTGTSGVSKQKFHLSIPAYNAITSATAADRTVWPANQSGNIAHGTAGKYKSATWRAKTNGNGLDFECDNTGEVFTVPSRNVGQGTFLMDNYEDYMETYYQQCEFYRALFAICSGIATNSADGATTTVEILNSSGQQASVNEDMYFWIGGTNTGLLAKYNLNCVPAPASNVTTAALTQAYADGIYNKQKANGVNMNDTGINSSSKHVLSIGMKGADAIAVDGYWYIKTPYIGNPSNAYEIIRNIPDARAAYICKHLGITIPSPRRLLPFYMNFNTHILSLKNLIASIENISIDWSTGTFDLMWTAFRSSSGYAYAIDNRVGYIASQQTNQISFIIPTTLSTQQFTT